jgi:protein-disulfide isomerase-like protein with CxxC motif
MHDAGPPVRAVVATRDLAGDAAAIDMHRALGDGMFVDGRAPDDPAQVHAVAAALGLDADAILARWQSPEGHAAAQAENARARNMGITTYPSMFLRRGPDQLEPLFAGFATSAQMVTAITSAAHGSGRQPARS